MPSDAVFIFRNFPWVYPQPPPTFFCFLRLWEGQLVDRDHDEFTMSVLQQEVRQAKNVTKERH